jgi:hypothetical protein
MGSTVAGITSSAMRWIVQAAALSGAPPSSTEGGDDIQAFERKIEKLKALKEVGLLSDEEFDQERKSSLMRCDFTVKLSSGSKPRPIRRAFDHRDLEEVRNPFQVRFK